MKKKNEKILNSEEIKESVEQERKWLKENNAVSAVSGGPVEDLEGIPIPADFQQEGLPPAHSEKKAAGGSGRS